MAWSTSVCYSASSATRAGAYWVGPEIEFNVNLVLNSRPKIGLNAPTGLLDHAFDLSGVANKRDSCIRMKPMLCSRHCPADRRAQKLTLSYYYLWVFHAFSTSRPNPTSHQFNALADPPLSSSTKFVNVSSLLRRAHTPRPRSRHWPRSCVV